MLTQLLIVALSVESLWENLKMIWQDGKVSVDKLGAIILGVVVCIGVEVDFYTAVGLPFTYPLVGSILSGVLVSRGANAIHDLLKKIEALS